jgi:hypothetical protein
LLVRTEMPITSNDAGSDTVGLDALCAGLGAFCAESEVINTSKSTDATNQAEVKRDSGFIVMGECTTCLRRSDKCPML